MTDSGLKSIQLKNLNAEFWKKVLLWFDLQAALDRTEGHQWPEGFPDCIGVEELHKMSEDEFDQLQKRWRLTKDFLKEVSSLLKCNESEIVGRVQSLFDEIKELDERITKLEVDGDQTSSGPEQKLIGAVNLLTYNIEGLNPKDLRSLVDQGKKQVGSGVVVVVGKLTSGKASLIVGVSDDLTDKITAVELVKTGAEILGGKGGGGRPDMAQAGGPDSGKAVEAIESIQAAIAELKSK